MTVTYRDSEYVAEVPFEQKDDIVKALGFQWNPDVKQWQTKNPSIAGKLEHVMDSAAWAQYQAAQSKARILQELSKQHKSDAVIPCPAGEEYQPFQKVGILFAVHQNNVLLADECGLGKTIETIGLLNWLQETEGVQQTLVICPANLKINWQRELDRFLFKNYGVNIVSSTNGINTAAVQIISYQILEKYEDAIKSRVWDVLAVDEAHYLKNQRSQRSRFVLGYQFKVGEVGIPPIEAKRKLYLTGTPDVNGRPKELWPLIHSLDPVTWDSWKKFAIEYCAAEVDPKTKKLKVPRDGASNLRGLQVKLRATIMVRRLKTEVLTELPKKRRQVIELPQDGCEQPILEELQAFELYKVELEKMKEACEKAKTSDDPEDHKKAVRQLRAGVTFAFSQIAKMRHRTALAKMPMVLAHLDALVKEEKLKVVVFGHHHDVLNAIKDHFKDTAVILTGEVLPKLKQAAVDRFQTDDTCRLFVGSTQAAGVGHTLTASSHVVFVELDWVPGVLSQAEDRCCRIGQLFSVLVQHLVLSGSLDATMAKRVIQKQARIDESMNPELEETVIE